MPHRSSVAQPWRMQASRYRLAGSECVICKNVDFPPRRICSKCGGHDLVEQVMSGEGVIETFTIIHTAPEGFEGTTPYAIGLIRLKEGPLITAQIVGDAENIEIGKDAKAVFRKLYEHGKGGLIHYGFKFEVVD